LPKLSRHAIIIKPGSERQLGEPGSVRKEKTGRKKRRKP